jgi:hypothetical protein
MGLSERALQQIGWFRDARRVSPSSWPSIAKRICRGAERQERIYNAYSLPRPAPLGKHRSARVSRAPQQARKLERVVALGARRQQTCPLQRIRSADFLINPVWHPSGFFHRRLVGCATTHAKGQQNAGLK